MGRVRTLLVANRGEIARRVMRSARAMGIRTVAVYAEPDRGAPFVREADVAVALGGTTATETYLDGEKLLRAAHEAGADAVHPGYGFLSENADFAQSVVEAGLTWVGPHPEAIAAMGDKLEAKGRLAAAGVPMLPSIEIRGEPDEALARAAAEMGYPVLVKAAGGGGGRGMRIVDEPARLAHAVASARREAKGAFGNDTVFLERYLRQARHIEVQVFGDRHGNVVHLFERECSIQRRHQKVVEEAPSPAVDPDLRRRLGEAAVQAAYAIGYDNAGTVEFLLDERGRFYFLEMNTRLQVEHPVTEEITGIDLVREQIRVAEGEPLSFRQEELRIDGHAIEVRLYAEDPEKEFFPAAGRLIAFRPPPDLPVRIETGVEDGSEVSIFFDPMLAKVIAHAPTRTEAALRLASALEGLRLPGLVTNRDFLVATLRHEAYLAGDTTTDFIERVQPARTRTVDRAEATRAAIAAALAGAAERLAGMRVLRTIPHGWRNNRSQLQETAFARDGEEIRVGYARNRDGSYTFEAGETTWSGRVHSATPGRVDFELGGLREQWDVFADGDERWLHGPRGQVRLRELTRYPKPKLATLGGGHTAPMPGKVVSVHVAPGDRVREGQLLVVLEAMKMEHHITAAAQGIVKDVPVSAGEQVDGGAMLVVLEAEEGTA